jgi:hypothetical protein
MVATGAEGEAVVAEDEEILPGVGDGLGEGDGLVGLGVPAGGGGVGGEGPGGGVGVTIKEGEGPGENGRGGVEQADLGRREGGHGGSWEKGTYVLSSV